MMPGNVDFSSLQVGKRYKIYHQSEAQKVLRYSVMDYLGPDETNQNNDNWNARPVAGTQSMPRSWISGIYQVHKSAAIILNGIAR
jgi:hypothetical protein